MSASIYLMIFSGHVLQIRLYGSNWKLQGNTSNPVRIFVFDGLLDSQNLYNILYMFNVCINKCMVQGSFHSRRVVC
ncbi:unnamed protein product [Brassica napus]|uniref:(rape) hypothetical protein n=1 Tax=Brassica napus TaxID=3708 RepID=A0A816RT60_BRANA|nr:unnamed protein product [Brassica napus]